MLRQGSIQQASAPTKRRIGRLRFLLELFVSSALIKVSAPLDGVLPLLVFGLGFSLIVWASVRRLRDIKKSVWWVSIILAAFPFGIVLGLTGLPAPDSNGDIIFKIVGGLYGVAYLAYLGVLLFKPSAYPKDLQTVPIADDQPGNELPDIARSTTGVNIKHTMQIEEHKLSRMYRLNGWQRIGVVFSALWCFGVVAKACYESYEAVSFNRSIAECCEEEKRRPFKKEKKAGEFITWCELADVCATGIKKPTAPQLLPFLALLLLPVVAGWLVVFLVIAATKWIRAGFKTK